MFTSRLLATSSLPLLAALALPHMAAAQVTREEIRREPTTPSVPTPGQRVTVEGAIERAPCPLADPRFGDVRITLSDVQFDGLQGVSAEALRSAWARYQGQTVPVATVCEIRDEAATILRRAGYLAAVQVPPQRIEENGVVRFDVLMARMTAIRVRGNVGRSQGIIARQLSPLSDQPVFNINEAERYLLLARDLPGYDVRMTLRPAGTVPGEVIGEVTVNYTPVEIDANFQNMGSRDVGRFGGQARVQLNGLTGMGDRTTIGFFSTSDFKEQQVLQLGHAFRANSDGLTISGDFTYAWTRPDTALGIGSNALVWSVNASYPLIRGQSRNLFAAFGLDYVDQQVEFRSSPAVTLSKDKLRVAFARIDYDIIDPMSLSSTRGYSAAEPRWRAGASLELRQGLDILGASEACGANYLNCISPRTALSRIDGDPTAFVARASGYAEFRPVPELALSLTPRAQWAPHALLSYEEFSGGNYTVGRGYDPGTIIGDSGLGVQAELRYGSLMAGAANKVAIQPYVFFDAAKVWNEDRTLVVLDNRSRLFSTGGGVRAAWGNHARLDAGLAVPLRKSGLQAERADPRLLVSLIVKFLPWNR
ncbi:ShlB/FhaC/HecB family hemolysin secretion/activation protein [Sphingomonas sp. C3-2]|uniref:ShlB/FhaC/HecB family hemolysin secretion/activation protein n=1 Tax=Sphingomonas sp. C3-2 TaxID=3062169 RepID=UPI00294AE421|nr:ShlB/FhaC/HecB family hemolysin secretion/activation protein [Sphingomonas sp. C3-2]WOK36557.1 ShlB/FhaC/HecB family hemolysin secretion/activation protein [Sphingomonas sp. C3-2]